MPMLDMRTWEMQNIAKSGDGLRTRKGIQYTKAPSGGTRFVGGFSSESPNTTEVWHYLFEQNTTTNVVTLRVFTEEFQELYSYVLGHLSKNPVITSSTTNRQILINSPAFSSPLYSVQGGGTIAAVKVPSTIEDFTALDLQPGHVCSFGDRPCIASGAVLAFGDGGIDPRTFVAENLAAIPGSVFDIFQAGDGALQIFTSAGVYTLPADAVGQGQTVAGFLSKVPGLETIRPRNAAFSNGVTAVLQRDSIVTLDGERIYTQTGIHKRFSSEVVEVDDMRQFGEIYATPRGFYVGFRSVRPFFIAIDLTDKTVSFVTGVGALVGVLRGRNAETLPLFTNAVGMPVGNFDFLFGATPINATLLGGLTFPESSSPVVRRVSTASENIGELSRVYTNASSLAKTVPTKSGDTIIGTSTWSATEKLAGRSQRTVRHSFASRETAPTLEVSFTGGDRFIDPQVSVEIEGQDPKRRNLE